jgi:hypothetical protein
MIYVIQEHRYNCKDCGKSFASLSGQMQHTRSTGHSPMQVRLIGVLISDADRSQRLMISDGPANANHEATLFFDGSAQPNPGAGIICILLVLLCFVMLFLLVIYLFAD